MVRPVKQDAKKAKRLLARYNIVPNLGWSIINLLPVCIFCWQRLELNQLYLYLAVSIFPFFLKNSVLHHFQFSNATGRYKKIGVHLVNRFSQNGSIINTYVKKKFPGYTTVSNSPASIARLISQTYVTEKFHWGLFIFFSLLLVQAIAQSAWLWSVIIFITNILYNVYPNLLQQYIRLKLQRYQTALKRKAISQVSK